MIRWTLALGCCAIPLVVSACGGSGKAKSADDADPADDRKWEEEPVKWDSSDQSNDEPKTDPSSSGKRPKRPAAVPDDYELSPADCEALGQNYRNVLHRSLMDKLEAAKLPEKQLPAAKEKALKDTEAGTDKWLDSCHAIVNSVQVRSRLQCALDAKTLDRFTGCWDGKFDKEAGE